MSCIRKGGSNMHELQLSLDVCRLRNPELAQACRPRPAACRVNTSLQKTATTCDGAVAANGCIFYKAYMQL